MNEQRSHTASGVSPAKKVPQSWVRGEKLVYEHASNGNHVLRPERPSYPRASYHVNDIALIWFTRKEDCDDWLKWWHEAQSDEQRHDHVWVEAGPPSAPWQVCDECGERKP